jgi:glucosamine-6-phosphate deaminase
MAAADNRRFASPEELGEAAARLIIDGIRQSSLAQRPYLLGCPGGRTPKPIFDALGERIAELGVDCSDVIIVMMDDYLEPSATRPTLVDKHAHHSCRRFAELEIRQVINRGLDTARAIPPESVWFPDPDDPADYDGRIARAGRVDLFIVASGASDGHVAFCGPGADLHGRTGLVELARSTRIDNTATFPDFESADDVPTRGISVGIGTLRELSDSVLMVLHGADKRESVRRIEAAAKYDPEWPATFVHECTDAKIWTDAEAQPSPNTKVSP